MDGNKDDSKVSVAIFLPLFCYNCNLDYNIKQIHTVKYAKGCEGMKKLEQLMKILLGNLLLAFSVNMFILPFSFIACGSTGFALIIHHFFQVPFTTVVYMINLLMFIIGFLALGKHFAFTTLLSTMVYPLFLELTSGVTNWFVLTNDPLVAAVCAGIVSGFALGLVIQSGASTGGLDIPPLIIEKMLGIPVGISMAIMDITIMLVQITFSSTQGILCGVIFVLLVSFVMNRILLMGKSQFQVMVMTKYYEKMRDAFLVDLNRGVTLFEVETGYLHNEQKTLVSIVSQKDLVNVKEKVYEVDNQAFMIISKVQEVRGEGFKSWKK